jgi:hypothetical protein
MYRLLLLLISAAGFCLCYLVYRPGLLSIDSLSIYSQARNFLFNDWHAPMMALLWAPLYRLTDGPQGMLALLLTLYWGALFVFSDAAARIERLIAPGVLVFGVMPFTINFAGTLWVDVLLATSWLMCAALAFSSACRGWPMSLPHGVAAWTLFFIGALARPNALFAAVPLGIYLFSPRAALSAGKQAVLAILFLAAVWLGNWSLSYPVLKAAKTYPIDQIITYDLAGISHFSGQNYLPLALNSDEIAMVVGSCYTPEGWNEYSFGDCGFVSKQLHGEGAWGSGSLWRAWFAAIAAEPAAYLQHRWAHFWYFTTSVSYVFHEGNDAEEVQHLQDNPRFRAMRDYVFGNDRLWMFRPSFWLILATACVPCARGCPEPSRQLISALGSSSVVYLTTYFFVGVASDFRYAYWAVLATGVASIIVACEVVAAARRQLRPPGSIQQGSLQIGQAGPCDLPHRSSPQS